MNEDSKNTNEEIKEVVEETMETEETSEVKEEKKEKDNIIQFNTNSGVDDRLDLHHYEGIVDPLEDMTDEEVYDLVSPYVDMSDDNIDKEDQIKKTVEYISYLESYNIAYYDLFCNIGETLVRLLDLDYEDFEKVVRNHRESMFNPSEFIGLRIASCPTKLEKDNMNEYLETIQLSIQCHIHNNPYKPEWWLIVQKIFDEKTESYIPMVRGLDMEDIYIGELFLDYVMQATMSEDRDKYNSLWDFYNENIKPRLWTTERTLSKIEWLIDSFDRGILTIK